jgi:hypothetical protein
MAIHFEFARRAARLRALLTVSFATAIGACDASEQLTSVSDEPTTTSTEAVGTEASFASRFRGGIPIGTSAQPTSAFGSELNGALRNIAPKQLVKELAAIKARGGKVVLMFAGSEWHYKDRRGHFDLGKWKARVSRYRNINFSSYLRDGTIIGHYLIDEPYDPANWRGKPVPGATLEEMGRYSKQLWPSMVTIVRAEPYLMKYKGRYRFVDAAWAQYLHRKGNVHEYIRRNVAEAQRMGLGLVVGLNLRHGGYPNKTWMSPSEIQNFGSALLSSSYPCAFISWQYNANFLRSRAVRSAMAVLRNRAQSRSQRSCRGK